MQMGPSREPDVSISASPVSGTASQDGARGTEGLDESAPSSARPQRDTEESSKFAVELAEIRRLRAVRYRASKEATLHPTSTFLRTPNSSGSSLHRNDISQGNTSQTLCSRSSKYKRSEEEHGSGVKKEGESTNASPGHSSCERLPAASELTPSGAPLSSRASPRPGPVASAARREVIVIDEDEEVLDNVNVLEADGSKENSFRASMKDTQQGASTDALPIWEDHFDLLTWNVNGLNNEALRPRTTAVVDLIAAVRPAVVFLQEVVPQTLALLRKKLGMSYIIFTPSLRISSAGTGSNSTSAGCNSDRDASYGSTCSQNAARALGPSDVQNDVGFPYFVVILLCREQMVPLTPEALCEWFPHSSMGRHMLGVVAAPVSRPDDRFLLLTSHLESLKTFHMERVSQFKRCMRVLTESFAPDDGERDDETEEHMPETEKGQRGDVEEESIVGSGGLSAHSSAHRRTCEGLQANDTKNCSPSCTGRRKGTEKTKKNVRDDEIPVTTRFAEDARRDESDCENGKLVRMADGNDEQENAGQGELAMTQPRKRDKPKAAPREVPAYVGIFGGDMNLRDSELQPRAPGVSSVQGQKTYRSISSDSSGNISSSGCRPKKTRKSEQAAAGTNSSNRPRSVNGDCFLLPGVQDVWEYLGCPPDAEFTWDMLQNDNEHGGKMRARLRFDRLYWYSAAAKGGEKKLPEKNTGRTALASARLCHKRRITGLEGYVALGRGGAAQRAAPASKATIPAEKVETVGASHRAGDPSERTCSCGRNGKEAVPVVRWTWKPESLQLVGTHRLPSCGRYPSDHFGLLARFRRRPTWENLPVSAA